MRTTGTDGHVIADAFLQQILTRPAEYDVIATLNLNGDYISDALAAMIGGLGIAPGAPCAAAAWLFSGPASLNLLGPMLYGPLPTFIQPSDVLGI